MTTTTTTTTPTTPPDGMDFPLQGVRVLDLSRVFAGPLCGMVLADFGAEVIKVEHPGRGDDTRDWGMRIGKTETTYYNSMNRNKRSITVDLQTPEGVKIIHDLLPQCDVVVQNFKTGGAEKLGLGYEQLKAIKPDLIYCSVAGYDSSGPEAKRPGYDLVIQGESGLMALNGEANTPPLKFGVAVVDLMTGMYAAQAVLAALFQRTRTGKGRHIEMALYDCGLMITGYYGLDAMLLGHDPHRYGNAHPSIVPYGMYDAADGPLIIAVGNNAQFDKFCRQVIERPDIVEDPRFATNVERAKNRLVLGPMLKELIAGFARDVLLQRMTAAGIPCGKVAGLHEALTSTSASPLAATTCGMNTSRRRTACSTRSALKHDWPSPRSALRPDAPPQPFDFRWLTMTEKRPPLAALKVCAIGGRLLTESPSDIAAPCSASLAGL